MPRPEARRLRTAFLLAIATSVCLVITSAMIILSVAPLLPTPDGSANLRLGLILALACSATLSSALLVATEVVNYRNHTRNFLCVPNSDAHLVRPGPSSSDAAPATSRTAAGSASSSRRQRDAATPSVAHSRSSDTIRVTFSTTGPEPGVKSGGSAEVKGQGAEKSSEAATQTERPGTI